MSTKLTILGSGTCNLRADKAAASVLIEKDDVRLVYDFGRGTAIRLTEAGLKQDGIEHIFISHFHPDHITDLLPYLHAASWSQIDRRSKDLTIYGPVGTKEFLTKLFAVYGKNELWRTFNLTITDVPGDELTINNQQFNLVDLHHSHGLRFGDIAIAGDANVSDDLVALLQNASLGVFDAGHITNDEICELAARTQAKKLVCSHQYRDLDEKELNSAAQAKGYSGQLIVACDLMTFTLG